MRKSKSNWRKSSPTPKFQGVATSYKKCWQKWAASKNGGHGLRQYMIICMYIIYLYYMHNQKMQFKFNMLKSSLKDVPKIHKLKLVLNQ